METSGEKEFYVNVLQSNGISDEVSSVEIKDPNLGGAAGTASSSEVVTIKFTNDKAQLNLFVKKETKNEGYADFVKEMNLFKKEATFFNSFVKDAKKFCEEKVGSTEFIDIFPKCYHATDEVIVLDNLMTQGCILLKKEDRQNLSHAKLALTKLAQLHGVSYAMLKTGGLENFKAKYDNLLIEAFAGEAFENMMSPMYDNSLRTAMKILQDQPTPGSESAVASLGSFIGTAFGKVMATIPYVTGDIIVLTHGDCWNNNMMFHQLEGNQEVDDVTLLDFQVARLASPCLDISYYLWTSVDASVRQQYLQELMLLYYNRFKGVVQALGERVEFSLEELLADYGRKVSYGYFMGLTSNCAPGAWAEVDYSVLDKDVAVLTGQVNEIVGNWVQRNPQEAAEIGRETVRSLQEYADATNEKNG